MREKTIIIAGAGEAGVAAAAAIRAGGHDGPITLVSDESPLPYERPPLSKAALRPVPAPDTLIRTEGWYREQEVTLLRSSRVVAIDPHGRTAQIRGLHRQATLHYDAFLIATGARPRRLPDECPGIYYLRTEADARALHGAWGSARRLAIIGGGVIGLEVAATARERGMEVTVVDPAARLMARAVAPEISDFLLDLHREAGVEIMLDSGTVDVRAVDGRTVVRAGATDIDADLCVAGIGVVPNDELGRIAGCAIDNGILVDECGRTSVPGIFAAGDVAAFRHPLYQRPLRVEAWQHAGRHGAHVGRAMIGVTDDYSEVPWFWTDQFGVNIQVAGLPADSDATVWRGEGRRRTGLHLRRGELCGVTTIDNGKDMRPAINLLATRWSGVAALLSDSATTFREISRRLLEGGDTQSAQGSTTPALTS